MVTEVKRSFKVIICKIIYGSNQQLDFPSTLSPAPSLQEKYLNIFA